MQTFWSSPPDKLWLEEGQLCFDTSGTPMDQDWSSSIAEFIDVSKPHYAHQFIRNAFGIEVLRELLARFGGPPPEAFPPPPPPPPVKRRRRARRSASKPLVVPAPVVASPPAPVEPPLATPDPDAPVALALSLLDALLAAAGLEALRLGPAECATHEVPMDGASGTVTRWRRVGHLGEGVEAAVEAEVSRWNPHTIARSRVSLRLLDRRGPELRALFLSAEPPWQTWSVRELGAPTVDLAVVERLLAPAGLTPSARPEPPHPRGQRPPDAGG